VLEELEIEEKELVINEELKRERIQIYT